MASASTSPRRARLLALLLVLAAAPAGPARGQAPAASTPAAAADPEAEIARLKEDAARKDEEIARLKENDEKLQLKLDELAGKVEMATVGGGDDFESGSAPEVDKALDIYGFFDVELFYLDTSDVKSVDGLMVNNLSFMVNRLNLYFLSHMTETLSAIAELRFTFLPNGYESSLAEPTYLGTTYQRTDTTVRDPFNQEEFQLGGVVIERVHFTWMPSEWLGVIAGRFLTPFGIWNVDHGSPVVIPINTPYFMSRAVLPLAQTGVQILGRFIPRPRFYIDYAITASNGRGPTQAFYDLDNNKAFGGRLRLSYEGNDVKGALGGYLYWGQVTDITKAIRYDVDSETDYTTYIEVTDTEKYLELVGTLDLSLDVYGVLVQGEFVRGQVRYEVRPVFKYPVINVRDPFGALQPDYNKWGAYGFLGYRIPILSGDFDMTLTPFAMAEYYVFDDTFDDYTTLAIRGGLNFKPSPFVTLKLEVERVSFPESKTNTGAMWLYAAQVAVSF